MNIEECVEKPRFSVSNRRVSEDEVEYRKEERCGELHLVAHHSILPPSRISLSSFLFHSFLFHLSLFLEKSDKWKRNVSKRRKARTSACKMTMACTQALLRGSEGKFLSELFAVTPKKSLHSPGRAFVVADPRQ